MRFTFIFALLVFSLSGCQKEGPWQKTHKEKEASSFTIEPIASRDYKDAALNIINNAKKYVYVWMFEMGNYRDEPNPLFSALCDARKRGVEVKVLMEGGENFLGERFYKKQKNAYKYLKSCNVDVRFDKPGRTTHVKMLLADTSLIIGSTNWTYYGIEKNTELNVLIKSAQTEKFKALFLKAFNNARKNNMHMPRGESEITIRGVVVYVSERISKRGRAYTIFKIRTNRKTYRVFIRGHHHIKKGEKLLVKGIFYKTKRVGKRIYHNEFEANYIRRI